MKLDSIIYDTNTLANALTERLTEESPTFKAMYPSETSTALVNLLAGYGSMLQYTIVSALANCYTNTAFSPSAIYQLAETLGNRLHGNASAKLYCNIERTTLKGQGNIVIPRHSVFKVEGIPFFNSDPIIFPQNYDKVNNVLLTQGEYTIVEFTTSGVAGEKFYFSNDFKCNMDMVKVFINDKEWDTTDSFLSLNSMQFIDQEQATTVMLRMSSDGRAFVKIGNNSNGSIPTSGSTVRIEYVSNVGSKGNIEKINMAAELMTKIYGVDNSVDTLLEVDIITPQPSYGGYDNQSLEILKESSPYVFASGNRAVRRNDYKAILLNKCGYIAANVWGEYEEAQTNGGYDKIMMNMVYYTGIKEIQHYDYRPMTTLSVIDSYEDVSAWNPVYYNDSVGTIRGFPGSYEIDLIYSIDNTQRIKYADKNGNGVLVCDPSDNNHDYSLYPYNDSIDLYDDGLPTAPMQTTALQGYYTDPDTGIAHDTSKLFADDNEDFISSGLYGTNGGQMRITFDSPLQIQILFNDEPRAISMFSFQTPNKESDIDCFPGLISIYATDEIETDSSFTKNVKNNSDWTRIAEVQTINIPEESGKWSDWITTNLYDPSQPDNSTEPKKRVNGWRQYRRYMIEFYTLHDETKNGWGQKCHIGQMKFVLDKTTAQVFAWGGNDQGDGTFSPVYYTKTDTPTEGDPVLDNSYNMIRDYVVKEVRSFGEGQTYLMMEDPDTHEEATDICSSTKTARNTAMDYNSDGSHKIITTHKTSTIAYEDNSLVDMCIPSVCSSDDAGVKMDYYKYSIEVTGLTAANGYKTGDFLTYSFNNGKIANVLVTNIDTGSYDISINDSIGVIMDADKVQTGNRQIDVSDVDLNNYYVQNQSASGAKLTMTSEDAIGMYGTFTGNAYSTATAQSIDSPVLEEYNHFTTYVEFKQPRVKNTKVEVTVEYSDSYSYKDTRKKVEEAINSVFDVTPYYIGKSLDVSDIWAAINNVAGVKRFIVTYPTDNISCKPYEFIALPANNLKITDKFSEDFK